MRNITNQDFALNTTNPKLGHGAPKGCSTVVDHYSTHIDQPKCYSGSFVVNKNLKGICLCS